MTREDILDQLRTAKTAHTQWLSDALALIAGLAAGKDHVPVSHRHCEFGQWYYGRGHGLASLSAYAAIEAPHEALHGLYAQVFDILSAPRNRPLLAKVFTPKGHLGKRQQDEAKALMQEMLSASRRLLEAIALLEQHLMEMSEQELQGLF
ncbi:CZB domain-containing protein [Thiocystis violacea]|uniref:CZB domain-containing protein n=1 Tax=Thiocystis violacea TaxID=13725 RepID=UPI0019045AF2|nr:CZB domain-containing protein [Thiocystis violacea]MBK1722930.1 hypothetical protein [Thiocystis violacea]